MPAAPQPSQTVDAPFGVRNFAPVNQNILLPDAGSGTAGIAYLSGSSFSIAYYPGGDSRVFYGEEYHKPAIPLPAGVTTFRARPGFGLSWSSTTGRFKLAWGLN